MSFLRSAFDFWLSAIALLNVALSVNRADAETVTSTTIYVGNHFEVRDHDQPTKYVFNGPTRVAAITGSLSANLRVQRIRLYQGWNLVSLAVTATNLTDQMAHTSPPGVQAVFQWTTSTGDYAAVPPGHSVPSGAVLWVQAATNLVASVWGAYSDPLDQSLQSGGTYLPGSGLEAWTPTLPGGVSSWWYDAQNHVWLDSLSGPLAVSANVPWTVAPGQAMFVNAETPVVLTAPDPNLRIRFYHQDHLGSSSVVTDQSGKLVEEIAFYPFGHARNEFKPRQLEMPYQFTQKECDAESGLDYFGLRFYCSAIGKWISPDPLEEKGGGLNLYAYVNENPLKHYDPNGAEVKVTYKETGHNAVYHIDVKAVVVNASSHHFSQQELQTYAKNLEATIKTSFSGSTTAEVNNRKGKVSWSTTVSIEVIDDPSKLKPDDRRHIFRIVDANSDEKGHSKGSAAGTACVGGRVMNIDLNSFTQKTPAEVDETIPGNKGYARAYQSPQTVGAHELGHDLGLPDIWSARDIKSLMSENRLDDSTGVTLDEIKIIYQQYQKGNLNRSDEQLLKEGKGVH